MMNRIALAIAILLSTASSSLAGSWSVSYRASGEYTYSNNPNVPWETNPLPAGDGSVHFSTTTPGGGVPGCSSSGAITATLTWVPSEPGDTPPDKVTIIETAFAYANWSFGAGSASASNGKGDREKEVSQYSKESKGWHAQTRSVPPGTTQIVLDPVDMSADAYGDTNPTRRSMAECSYKVTEGTIAVDARSTAGTADSNKPRFFSGTNCVATGYANISPARIIRAELVINNETVNRTPRYPYNPDHPEDTPSSATVRAAFDSTHFSHNTPVTIKMRIYDHRGRAHIRELKAPTYNKGFSFANTRYDIASAALNQMTAAAGRMAKTNHPDTRNSSWTVGEITEPDS